MHKPTGYKGARKWAEFHRRAYAADLGDAPAERAWLASFLASLPCGPCKDGWRALTRENPPDLSAKLAYFKWGWLLHNAVRTALGQETMSLEDALSLWQPQTTQMLIPKRPPQWRVNRGHPEAVAQMQAFEAAKLHRAVAPPAHVGDLRTYADRVIVISLERTPDRLTAFWERLSAIDWPLAAPTWLPAVDGMKEDVPRWWKEGGPAWGCLQSHKKAIAAALADGVNRLLILEDDAAFPADFAVRLREFLEKVPGDWDCLMIGGQQMHDGFVVGVSVGVMRVSQCERTHCYMLSRRGMRSLLEWWSRDVTGHCDWQLGDWQARVDVKCYRPDPVLAAQAENFSTIRYAVEPTRTWDKRLTIAADARPRIFATVTVYDTPELLPHFCDHYARLGVDQILVVANVDLPDQAQLLKRFPVRVSRSHYDKFDNDDKNNGEESMLDAAGARPSDWVLRLDLDEFHQYPAHLHDVVAVMNAARLDAISGHLYDRLAESGRFEPVRPTPDIGQQFPIGLWITSNVTGAWTQKIMIARRRVKLRHGRHATIDGTSFRTVPIGDRKHYRAHHFRWVQTLPDRILTRFAKYVGRKDGGGYRAKNVAMIERYKREGRFDYEGRLGSAFVGSLQYPQPDPSLPTLLRKQRTTWEIDDSDWAALFGLAKKHRVRNVMEFGPGRSTLLWMLLGCKVTAYESDPRLLPLLPKVIDDHPGVEVHPWPPKPGRSFDLAFVDGPRGTATMSRLEAVEASIRMAKVIVMHDAKRSGERQTLALLAGRGLTIREINTPRGLAIIQR